MNEASALVEAITISAIGMSVVFIFLGCLVIALYLLPFLSGQNLQTEKDAKTFNRQPVLSARSQVDKKRAVAIAVALHEFRKQHDK